MRILWIPHTGWHIPQRAHLFCRALAERHELHVTDWVADFTSWPDYFSRRYLRNFTYRRYRDGKISVHGVPRISPALPIKALRRLNTAIFSRLVDYLIKQYAIDVVVGTFLVPPPKAPRLVFDLFDDNVAYWRGVGAAHAYADEIEQTELSYLEKADVVVAASSVLADKAHSSNASGTIKLIPNGVDLGLFNRVDGTQVRQKLGVQGKLVGSVGNHDNFTELKKILDAAKMLADQEVTFLIAGRGAAVPAAQRRAKEQNLSNVIFSGYVPLDQAVNLITALDVGLCPYSKSAMDDARSPMRLLMYTAAGVPTVCTNLEEVQRLEFPQVVLVDDSSESFAQGIRRALKLRKSRPAQLDRFDINRLVEQYEAVLKG